MSGICSAHIHHEQGCPRCEAVIFATPPTGRADSVACSELVGDAPPETPESKAAGWWAMGWLRSYQETPDEHAQLIPRMIAAEARYQRAICGGMVAVNGASPTKQIADH